MKVAVVDPSLFSLPYDRALCRALGSTGAEVVLVGRPLRPHEALAGEPFTFRPLFYPLAEGRMSGLGPMTKLVKGLEHASGWRALSRMIEADGIDIVHLQWLALARVDARALRALKGRVPLVHTMHNSVPFHGGSSLQAGGYGTALAAFDAFIGHTAQTGRFIAGLGVPAERYRIMAHPPISLTAAPAARGDGPVRILFFGSVKQYKGVDVLVRAGIAMAARRHDFTITIAGRAFIDTRDLVAMVDAAGCADVIRFDLRFIPDAELGQLVAAADIAVFPYRDIDASGAFTVAVDAEKPIVATAIGVFTEPPAAGRLVLVPPDDETALAMALERLVADPAARAAQTDATRAIKAETLSWDDFARGSLELYASLRQT